MSSHQSQVSCCRDLLISASPSVQEQNTQKSVRLLKIDISVRSSKKSVSTIWLHIQISSYSCHPYLGLTVTVLRFQTLESLTKAVWNDRSGQWGRDLVRCQNVEILQSKHPGQHCWADYSRVPQSWVLSQRYCQTLTSVEYHQHTGEYKVQVQDIQGVQKVFRFTRWSNVDQNYKNSFLWFHLPAKKVDLTRAVEW